jgi:hypothetical protein
MYILVWNLRAAVEWQHFTDALGISLRANEDTADANLPRTRLPAADLDQKPCYILISVTYAQTVTQLFYSSFSISGWPSSCELNKVLLHPRDWSPLDNRQGPDAWNSGMLTVLQVSGTLGFSSGSESS